MRETYSTIRHLLHLATELDRACALFLSTHVSITHDEARVLLELGAAQLSLRPGALAKQLNLQPSTLSRVLRNLENRGFIERHRTTEDARSLSLSLTYLGARTAKRSSRRLIGSSTGSANIWIRRPRRSFECFSGRNRLSVELLSFVRNPIVGKDASFPI